jgi:3-oxoacyl-[acyl-carrier-protein] synthase II
MSAPFAVAITGMGSITAAGAGVQALWTAVQRGQSLGRWRKPEQPTGRTEAVCSLPENALTGPVLNRLRRMDRSIQLAAIAAREAWENALLHKVAPAAERVAIFAGTSRGPVGLILNEGRRFVENGRVLPSVAPNSTFNCLSGALSSMFSARGPCLTISAACASSAGAIVLAAQQIAMGTVDVALAGGAEAPLHDWILAQLRSTDVLASHVDPARACRPFDTERNGTILGEGAAFLVLESPASARRRGALSQIQLAGWGLASEAGKRTGINRHHIALCHCMDRALEMAKASPVSLGYINAHGTGTDLNDRLEAQAINRLGTRSIATSSTKAVTGHCMGAAAAVEAVVSILAIQNQQLPPTANCECPAEDCPLELVLERPRTAVIRSALSNSSGFWGSNASLLFRRIS